MTDKEKLEAVRAEIHKLVRVNGFSKEMANALFAYMNSLPGESASEDLEAAALSAYPARRQENKKGTGEYDSNLPRRKAFVAGANWKGAHLWKDAQSDDLPEINREVLVLTVSGKVVFAHRPPEYWDGKDIVTGKVTRHFPKTYDKGGWNMAFVRYWLDAELPEGIR